MFAGRRGKVKFVLSQDRMHMKLITRVEYYTRWGEELFLRAYGSLFPMKYGPGSVWTAEMDGLEPGRNVEYIYFVRIFCHLGGIRHYHACDK